MQFSNKSATLGQEISIEGGILPAIKQNYKRYPVAGRVQFHTESMEATGELIDIGKWGAQFRSEIKPNEREEITARLKIHDYPRVFEVRGVVVRVQSDLWAMMFLEAPVGWAKLRQVLDERTEKQVASPIGT